MSGLGEQIAVLDGLDAMDPNDGRIGQSRAAVDQYGRPVMPGVIARTGMVSASGGQNYGGGSNYAPRLPLMPSSVGLAGGDADALIRGGYGRAGLGADLIEGGYGRAGLGMTNSSVDEDLAGAMEAMETARASNDQDGRIGQSRAKVDEYGRPIMPGVLERSNVLDASGGANYSGGSNHAPRLPLMPSSVGLAGLGNIPSVLPTRKHVIDYSGGALYSGGSNYAPGLPMMPSSVGLAGLDAASDKAVGMDERTMGKQGAKAAKKVAGRARIKQLKSKAKAIMKMLPKARGQKRAKLERALSMVMAQLEQARAIRQRVYQARGGKYAARMPLWAR